MVESELSEQSKNQVMIQNFNSIMYKNIRAYWEQEMRQGTYLPDYSSKYICQQTLREIKEGKILKMP
jgi:hypothetical protein